MHRRRCRLTSAFCAFSPIIRKAIFKVTSLLNTVSKNRSLQRVDKLNITEFHLIHLGEIEDSFYGPTINIKIFTYHNSKLTS